MSDKHEHDFVEALQYLYYVKSDSPWSDFEYDMYCKAHGIEGGGGSDLESSYSEKIKELASLIAEFPEKFSWRKVDRVTHIPTSNGWLPVRTDINKRND